MGSGLIGTVKRSYQRFNVYVKNQWRYNISWTKSN